MVTICIIVYHPEKAEVITKKTLKICFKNNDDGAGYTYWDGEKGKWIIKKGFMTWGSFWNAFKKHEFTKNDAWAAHFRIATSGNTDSGNTHPFPITNSYDEMRELELETDMAAFHNGIMGTGEEKASDTMKHIKKCLHPLRKQFMKDEFLYIMKKLCDISSNRWLIATTKEVLFLGDWKKHEGSYFSNTSYEKLKWSAQPTVNNQNSNYNKGNYTGKYPKTDYWNSKEYENYRNWSDYYQGDGKFDVGDFSKCVACGEEEFIGPSMFSDFKLRCFKCGCVFDPVTEKVSFFVPAEYDKGGK